MTTNLPFLLVGTSGITGVFENLETFKTMPPVFSRLDIQSMIKQSFTSPLYDEARKYYRERGFL